MLKRRSHLGTAPRRQSNPGKIRCQAAARNFPNKAELVYCHAYLRVFRIPGLFALYFQYFLGLSRRGAFVRKGSRSAEINRRVHQSGKKSFALAIPPRLAAICSISVYAIHVNMISKIKRLSKVGIFAGCCRRTIAAPSTRTCSLPRSPRGVGGVTPG